MIDRFATLRRDTVLLNTFYLVGNTALLAGSGFVFWLVAARRFPAADVGLATAAVSVTLIVTTVSTAGFGFSALRFIASSEDMRHRASVANVCILGSFVVGAIGSVVSLALLRMSSPLLAQVVATGPAAILFVLFVALQTAAAVADNLFTGLARSEIVFWKNAGVSALRIAGVALAPTLGGALVVFGANTAPLGALLLLVSLPLLFRLIRPYDLAALPTREHFLDVLRFGMSAHVANLLYMAPQLLLPVIVLNRLGPEHTAYLYTAWKIAGLLWVVTTAASGPLLAFGGEDVHAYRRALRRTLLFSLAGTFVLGTAGVAARMRLLGLFGEGYAENAGTLFMLLIASSVPLGMFALYLTTLRVFSRTRELLAASAVFAAGAVSLFMFEWVEGLDAFGASWFAVTFVFGVLALARLYGPLRISHLSRGADPVRTLASSEAGK